MRDGDEEVRAKFLSAITVHQSATFNPIPQDYSKSPCYSVFQINYLYRARQYNLTVIQFVRRFLVNFLLKLPMRYSYSRTHVLRTRRVSAPTYLAHVDREHEIRDTVAAHTVTRMGHVALTISIRVLRFPQDK